MSQSLGDQLQRNGIVTFFLALTFFFITIFSARKFLHVRKASSKRWGTRMLLVGSVLMSSVVRCLTFVSLSIVSFANVDENGAFVSNGDTLNDTTEFYTKNLDVLFNAGDYTFLSAYILLVVVTIETFQITRRHYYSTDRIHRTGMIAYLVLNTAMYAVQFGLYASVFFTSAEQSRRMMRAVYLTISLLNFTIPIFLLLGVCALICFFSGFPFRSDNAKKRCLIVFRLCGGWTVGRILWGGLSTFTYSDQWDSFADKEWAFGVIIVTAIILSEVVPITWLLALNVNHIFAYSDPPIGLLTAHAKRYDSHSNAVRYSRVHHSDNDFASGNTRSYQRNDSNNVNSHGLELTANHLSSDPYPSSSEVIITDENGAPMRVQLSVIDNDRLASSQLASSIRYVNPMAYPKSEGISRSNSFSDIQRSGSAQSVMNMDPHSGVGQSREIQESMHIRGYRKQHEILFHDDSIRSLHVFPAVKDPLAIDDAPSPNHSTARPDSNQNKSENRVERTDNRPDNVTFESAHAISPSSNQPNRTVSSSGTSSGWYSVLTSIFPMLQRTKSQESSVELASSTNEAPLHANRAHSSPPLQLRPPNSDHMSPDHNIPNLVGHKTTVRAVSVPITASENGHASNRRDMSPSPLKHTRFAEDMSTNEPCAAATATRKDPTVDGTHEPQLETPEHIRVSRPNSHALSAHRPPIHPSTYRRTQTLPANGARDNSTLSASDIQLSASSIRRLQAQYFAELGLDENGQPLGQT